MYKLQQERTGSSRPAYATCTDFCRVFAADLNQLYLLAFLMTANHQRAEECFVEALDETFQNRSVFVEFVQAWTRRTVIRVAIRNVFGEGHCDEETHDRWWKQPCEAVPPELINAITDLPSLDRFVFVMLFLERYSAKECALLLDCSVESVMKTRVHVLQELALCRLSFERKASDNSWCMESTA